MKKYALPLVISSLMILQACNEAPETMETVVEAPADSTLETGPQRLSYGIAFGMGQRMVAEELPLDVDAFALGLRDALEGNDAKLNQEQVAEEMNAYQQKAQAKQEAAQAAASEGNIAAAAAFLAENATHEGVVVTASGLQYEVVEVGTGAMPGLADTVEVHYRGTLIDGTEFDSSYSRGETVSFGVGQVIPGWTEALQLMPVGSTWKLTIPADLAYGAGGAGAIIGPHAALIFDVELVSIAAVEAGAAQ